MKNTFVSERKLPKTHKKVCRRCNKIYDGSRQSRYCLKCYKPNANKKSRISKLDKVVRRLK
jgi:hypothetical protein